MIKLFQKTKEQEPEAIPNQSNELDSLLEKLDKASHEKINENNLQHEDAKKKLDAIFAEMKKCCDLYLKVYSKLQLLTKDNISTLTCQFTNKRVWSIHLIVYERCEEGDDCIMPHIFWQVNYTAISSFANKYSFVNAEWVNDLNPQELYPTFEAAIKDLVKKYVD